MKLSIRKQFASHNRPILVVLTFLSTSLATSPQQDHQQQAIQRQVTQHQQQQRVELENDATSNKQSASTTSKPTTNLNNTWIESILIQVENLNFNNNAQRPERGKTGPPTATATATEGARQSSILAVDGDESEPASSKEFEGLMQPTDSAEDPLEATTTRTVEQSSNVTQSSEILSQQKPTTSTSNEYSQPSQLAPTVAEDTPSEAVAEAEETLVDSNNVSAVLSQTQENNSILSQIVNQIKQPISCQLAYTQCALRKACAPALRAYNDDCNDLISNKTSSCSPKCLKAMIGLRSTEAGDDLMNCDCSGDEYCLQSKQKSQACLPQVEQAIDPKTVVSCSTASWICLANQLCRDALSFYYRYCQSLFSQKYCSMRCNNSLAVLHRQPKASKLINCHCDGSEEFPCVKYKTYTERFCLNKPTQWDSAANAAAAAAAATEDDQAAEEDSSLLNMTNDPETFALPTSGGQDEDEYDEPKVAENFDDQPEDNQEESVANGIQPTKDNWILLVGNRYFTNLHQQQQKEQQQQLRRQQLKQTAHHHDRKQQQQLPNYQQQRKSQQRRNVKPKDKVNNAAGYHDIRRRYSRIFMQASSSSSSSSTVPIFIRQLHWMKKIGYHLLPALFLLYI